jgi:hypothetical protein
MLHGIKEDINHGHDITITHHARSASEFNNRMAHDFSPYSMDGPSGRLEPYGPGRSWTGPGSEAPRRGASNWPGPRREVAPPPSAPTRVDGRGAWRPIHCCHDSAVDPQTVSLGHLALLAREDAASSRGTTAHQRHPKALVTRCPCSWPLGVRWTVCNGTNPRTARRYGSRSPASTAGSGENEARESIPYCQRRSFKNAVVLLRVDPRRASMGRVNAVPKPEQVSRTMSGKRSAPVCSAVRDKHINPRP